MKKTEQSREKIPKNVGKLRKSAKNRGKERKIRKRRKIEGIIKTDTNSGRSENQKKADQNIEKLRKIAKTDITEKNRKY